MTLPNERRRAVTQTEQFLRDLCDPQVTPKIPKTIRERASGLLRHYPLSYQMDQAKELAPALFGEWDSEYK